MKEGWIFTVVGRGRTRKFREREEDAESATVHLAQRARGRLIRLGRYSVSGGHGNEGKEVEEQLRTALDNIVRSLTPVLKVVRSREKH